MASLGLLVVSCDSYKDKEANPDDLVEGDKNFAGEWRIASVKRNTIDITESLKDDLPDFRLHMNADGSYRLANGMPFPVEEDGLWSVDDPKHPFVLSFTENNSVGAVDVEITYPIVKGERQMSITHFPGCDANKYEYLLVRVK